MTERMKFVSRFEAAVGHVISDTQQRQWVVIGVDFDCGGNCKIHRVVRANGRGIFAQTRFLADERFDRFQLGYIP